MEVFSHLMTYWDYKEDQKDLGLPIKYTRKQYNELFYGMRTTFQGKRKRQNGGRQAAPKKFKKGFDRTGGNYRRYSGANAELKFHDVDLDDTTISASGTVTPTVNIIPQGVTEITRVGRKCVIKKIGWKYTVGLPTNGNISLVDTARIIMFLDKQCNGATAAVLDVLETADYQSFRNLANSQRFTILHDKVYDINTQAAAGDGTTNDTAAVLTNAAFYKDCNIPVEFDATSGAIGTIKSNNIGVLLISESGTARFNSKIRLRFSDGS